MIKFEEFYFDSRDKITKIHAVKWIPDREIKCVVQLVHGMAEHIERYDEFARYLASEGILVVGNDHLGHGKTANTEDELGYFCKEDGATVLVRDVHRLKKIIQEQNLGKPYFICGHSMGSLIVRNYITRYGKGIDGAVIVGTTGPRGFLAKAGIILCDVLAKFFGWKHKSRLVNHILFGRFNDRISDSKDPNAWVCANEKILKKYNEDDKCGFIFTLNGFKELSRLSLLAEKKENLAKIPKDLPVYLLSGVEDPVGDYGEGVKKVYENYNVLGITNIEMKLYEGDRHEILNEEDRFRVYEDIYHWIMNQMEK